MESGSEKQTLSTDVAPGANGTPPSLPNGATIRHALALAALAAAVGACAYFFYLHGGLLAAYLHLVDIKTNPYRWTPQYIQWKALAIAAGAALVWIFVGLLALETLDLYIPDLARFALAYVVGMGAVGVALEVETIFGLHSRESVVGTVGALAVIFLAIAWWRNRRSAALAPHSTWGMLRRDVGREAARRYQASLESPLSPLARAARAALLAVIAFITLLTFFHGALCPETYWDSLILYTGYAREIFYQKAFPFKAVAQVGVGLGANYPHLYALLTAATATAAGEWSNAYAQVAPPLAGLMTCFLVYHIALHLTRHRLLALALTAVFRAVPYGIAYFIYGSDYAFVMLFVAAFLYTALLYLETGLAGYFVLATLIPAFAMHLNYLMGLLWVIWAAMIVLAHWRPVQDPPEEKFEILDESEMPKDLVALHTRVAHPPSLLSLLATGRFWGWLFAGLLIASPWYVRNWVLTGNPVYAFFTQLFPKTVHYNQEVMDSAAVEWTLNGDGIGAASLTREFWEAFEQFRRAPDVRQMEIARIHTPLARKLAASWRFWVTDFHTWKHAPALMGIAVPGLLIFLLGGLRGVRLALSGCAALDLTRRADVAARRFGWLCALLLVLLLAYHYLLADFYLYQIIPFVVLIPIFGAYTAQAMIAPLYRGLFVALALWMAIFPGLPMALMGFKINRPVNINNRIYAPNHLVALHYLGIEPSMFYEFAFGEDVYVFMGLNVYCVDEKVLTHENRHLLIDRRVKIVHFDDWELQALWGKPPEEQLRGLHRLGVTFYMFVPNEIKHQVNRRLGPPARGAVGDANPPPVQFSALRGWIEDGTLKQVDTFGDNQLYRFEYPASWGEPGSS
ncbi:MAG: hypothetical protein N3D11_15950 [Candidatus Sumerlaeia bacterium]|nr:hypothetical protein [Candidatus Sumerlaeia bacterium]